MSAERETAFAQMVNRQRKMIEHVCSDYSLSAAWTAEDAVQEVLCTLWRDFDSFDGRSNEKTWVYRVATNTMLMLKRKMSNQPQPQADGQYNPSEDRQQYDHLLLMIEALPEIDRRIVRARLDGFSTVEVAQITGLSVPTVVRRFANAKRQLKKEYFD